MGMRQYPEHKRVNSVNGRTDDVTLSKSDVGLGNVDNTSDADKPVSTATQTALDTKAPSSSPTLADPTFTGTATFASNGTATFLAGLRTAAAVRSADVSLNSTSLAVNLCDASSGPFTITLPSTTTPGYRYTIKKIDSSANVVTVTSAGTSFIDNVSSATLSYQNDWVEVVSTTTAGSWKVIGGNRLTPTVAAEDLTGHAASTSQVASAVAGAVKAVAISTGALDLSSYNAANQSFMLPAATGNITFDATNKRPLPLLNVLSRWSIWHKQATSGGPYTFTVTNATWLTGTATPASTIAGAVTKYDFLYDGTTVYVSAFAQDVRALTSAINGLAWSPWATYTPTTEGLTSGFTITKAVYRTRGDEVDAYVAITLAGNNTAIVRIGLPVATTDPGPLGQALLAHTDGVTQEPMIISNDGSGVKVLFNVAGTSILGRGSTSTASGYILVFHARYSTSVG